MSINTTRWDSAEYLKIEEDIQLYLEAFLKKLERILLSQYMDWVSLFVPKE